MRTMRAALLWAGIGLATLLFGLPALLAAFVPPRGDWFLRFARGWARTILFLSGVAVRVEGRERLVLLAPPRLPGADPRVAATRRSTRLIEQRLR